MLGAIMKINKIAIWILLLLFWSGEVAAQTPYFQGKTIRFVVGYPAGSTHDLWARLVGPYMTKLIPGNPNTIVQNMPGAGSAVAANYVYGIAKPDGLTHRSRERSSVFRSVVRTQGGAVRLVQVRV